MTLLEAKASGNEQHLLTRRKHNPKRICRPVFFSQRAVMKSKPEIGRQAFECPHCGAFSHQHWFRCFVEQLGKDDKPEIAQDTIRRILEEPQVLPAELRDKLAGYATKVVSNKVFFEDRKQRKPNVQSVNLTLSKCFTCEECAVWVGDQLVNPVKYSSIPAHESLPKPVRVDYDEAGRLFPLSARAAAALLRLCISRLIDEAGIAGETLTDKVTALVARGFDPNFQHALQFVRVIGPDAVQPGRLDPKDDQKTALTLFELVNLLSDELISKPRRVSSLLANLPGEALAGAR
jgi:hypothetical protein